MCVGIHLTFTQARIWASVCCGLWNCRFQLRRRGWGVLWAVWCVIVRCVVGSVMCYCEVCCGQCDVLSWGVLWAVWCVTVRHRIVSACDCLLSYFLGVFQNCERWISFYYACSSVRPYVCPRGTTRLPLDGFSWSFIFEDFSTICRENSSFISTLQK